MDNKIENNTGSFSPLPEEEVAMVVDEQVQQKMQREAQKEVVKFSFGLRHLHFSNKARLAFYDQLSTLVGSDVSLIDSLSLIQAQERNKTVKQLYAQMIHDINAGLSLAEAMERFPKIFPAMQSALIESAEASGNLKEVLSDLVSEMESSQDFYRKITGAMVYPVIIVFLSLSLVVGMMVFVIPKVAEMYNEANVELPSLTQTMIDISDFVLTQWPILLISIVAFLSLFYLLFTKVRAGRWAWESMMSFVPIAGRISKEKHLMMMASNMAMLLKSGVLITEAFAITKKTINNLHYKRAIQQLREGVVMGKEVSQLMGLEDLRAQKFKEHPLFPLQVAQLIHIGERTGNIGLMFGKIKANYHKAISYSLKNISVLIEPIMLFIMAALVGTVLMAVMLPFFYIGTTV